LEAVADPRREEHENVLRWRGPLPTCLRLLVKAHPAKRCELAKVPRIGTGFHNRKTALEPLQRI